MTALSERQGSKLLVERTVLDEQVTAACERDPSAWSPFTWLGPLLAAGDRRPRQRRRPAARAPTTAPDAPATAS